MSLREACLALLVVTSAAAGGGVDSHGGSAEVPSAPFDWAFHHQPEILDRVMPVRPFAPGEFPFREAYWIVRVRIVSNDSPEERLTLTRRSDGGLVLVRDRPAEGSVTESVNRLLMAGVHRSIESVASKLELVHTSVDVTACPILRSLGLELERLRLRTMPRVGVVVHGATYEFVVQHQSGYFLQGEAYGLGGDQREDEPFAEWARRLRQVMSAACTGKLDGDPKGSQ